MPGTIRDESPNAAPGALICFIATFLESFNNVFDANV